MSDWTPTAEEAARAMEKAKASPIFAAAYEAVFERRRALEAEQSRYGDINAELTKAVGMRDRAVAVLRSANVHCEEAEKVRLLAVANNDAANRHLQVLLVRAQAILDAGKAARA